MTDFNKYVTVLNQSLDSREPQHADQPKADGVEDLTDILGAHLVQTAFEGEGVKAVGRKVLSKMGVAGKIAKDYMEGGVKGVIKGQISHLQSLAEQPTTTTPQSTATTGGYLRREGLDDELNEPSTNRPISSSVTKTPRARFMAGEQDMDIEPEIRARWELQKSSMNLPKSWEDVKTDATAVSSNLKDDAEETFKGILSDATDVMEGVDLLDQDIPIVDVATDVITAGLGAGTILAGFLATPKPQTTPERQPENPVTQFGVQT